MLKLFKNRWLWISVALFTIIYLALSLRTFQLGRYDFWFDEAANLLDTRSILQLPTVSNLINNPQPANEYLHLYQFGILSWWQKSFSNAEFTLRFSSVLFSLLTLLILFLLAKRFLNTKIAFIVCFLFALSPFSLHYAQEVSQYSLVCFLSCVMLYAFLQASVKNKPSYLYLYAAASVLNVYVHFSTLLLLLSFCIYALCDKQHNKHIMKPFILMHLFIVIFLIPAAISIYKMLSFWTTKGFEPRFSELPIWGIKHPSLVNLMYTLKSFSVGYQANLYSLAGFVGCMAYSAMFLTGIYQLVRKEATRSSIVYCAIIPVLLLFSLGQFTPCYIDRYLSCAFPFYLLIVAVGFCSLRKNYLAVFLIIVMAISNVFTLKAYYSNQISGDPVQHPVVWRKQNIRPALNFIVANYQQGDRIMHTSKKTTFPFKFYIQNNSPHPGLFEEVNKGTVIFQTAYFKNKDLYLVNYDLAQPRTFLPTEYLSAHNDLKETRRLWLIFSNWEFKAKNDNFYAVVKELSHEFAKVEKYNKFDGMWVYLFSNN